MSTIKWRTDFSKFVITSNFERRGWQEAHEGSDEWDIYWANVNTIRQLFSTESLAQLRNGQLINHFPNHQELTRKDLLVKNIKRYRRQAHKSGTAGVPQIIPSTYVLPQEYAIFVEAFRQQRSNTTFILKPNSKAQGKGIFLVNKLSQVRQRAEEMDTTAGVAGSHNIGSSSGAGGKVPPVFVPAGSSRPGTSGPSSSSSNSGTPLRPALDNYIVSRYIHNPLLLGGKKFDLRLYVLVMSYRPLLVYLSTHGFARFCNVKYSREVAELDNMFVHLTNVAVQKGGGSAYNTAHGNKWSLEDLRLHLEATRGHGATAQLFEDIQELVLHTLKAVQQVMINDCHCFELYGFDVIIDNGMTPWLIEVNASPSLTTTTKADRLLKFKVINDTLNTVTPPTWNMTAASVAGSSSTIVTGQQTSYLSAVGSMQLIYDERAAPGSRRKAGQPAEVAATDEGSSKQSSGTATAIDPKKRIVLHG